MPSESWGPRGAGGVIQSQSRGLRTKGEGDVNPSPGAGEDEMPQLFSEAGKKGQIPPSSAFCSIQALNGWHGAHPHWGGQSALPAPPIQMLISSGNTLTDTPETMFNLAPVTHSS